jgi:hypothetical protein
MVSGGWGRIRALLPERGCLSRSPFDKPKPRGISCAYSAVRLLRVGHSRSVPFGQHAPRMRSQRLGCPDTALGTEISSRFERRPGHRNW